jgi:hypothetical protein
MLIFNDKDRIELNDWLNQRGQVPSKIDALKKQTLEFSYIILYTNRLGVDIKDTFGKGDFCLLNNGQSINVAKSALSIKELFIKNNKKIRTQEGVYAFNSCIDLFMILDLDIRFAKNVKNYILNVIKKDSAYVVSENIKTRNYLSLECNSKKINSNKFIEEFIDYDKIKKVKYYSSFDYYYKNK